MAAQNWPECGPNAARMLLKFRILWSEINQWKFLVAQAQPVPKQQAQNLTHTMKIRIGYVLKSGDVRTQVSTRYSENSFHTYPKAPA